MGQLGLSEVCYGINLTGHAQVPTHLQKGTMYLLQQLQCYFLRILHIAEELEIPKADFQSLQRSLLSFSTPSAVCQRLQGSQLTAQHLTSADHPILVPPSAASKQQLGLKMPASGQLKPRQVIEHLGFQTKV
jgi:hypothetical protein